MRPQLLLVLLAIVAAAVTAFLWLGGEPQPAPGHGPHVTGTTEPESETAIADPAAALVRGDDATRAHVDVVPAPVSEDRAPAAALRVLGRVVDTGGAGVANAEVFARSQPDFGRLGRDRGRRDVDFRAMFTRTTDPGTKLGTTDASGYYELTAALRRDERLEVAARRDGLSPTAARVEFEGVDTAPAEIRVADLVLDVGTEIRGRVVAADGSPVADARVTARAGFGGPGRGGWREGASFEAALVETVSTDGLGAFVLRGMPEGSWSLTAEATGYLDGRSDNVETDGEAAVEGVQIEVTLGAPLAGRVVDEAGQPVAGAVLTVTAQVESERGGDDRGRRRMFARFRGGGVEAETDESGEFAFDAVPRGAIGVEVEHDAFLTAEREPVDALATPRIEFTLRPRPAITGVVVDAESGTPIETFGLEARRLDGRGWDRRGWGRGDEGDEREAYLKSRLGGSGIVAGDTPEPSTHAAGRFTARDLLPGRYALDVDAPGYVRIAAAVVELEAEAGNPDVTLRLQRGTTVRGVVVDADAGTPVARARVDLLLPPPPETAPAGGAEDDARRAAMRELFRGPQRGLTEIETVTTDAEGRFVFSPVLGGAYVLRAEQRGFSEFENESFFVAADRDVVDARIELTAGATVHGRVVGHESGTRANVVFTMADGGERRSATVDADSGTYEIRGLEAGGYFVEVESGRRSRRGFDFEARMQSLAGRTPHVIVAAGQDVTYDVFAEPLDVGRVTGLVLENGSPATGFEVRLERLDPLSTAATDDPEQTRMLERVLSRMARGRVDAEGRFEIDEVLPGAYRLEVSAGGGRGFDSGSAIHAEQVVVGAGATADVQIAFSSGKLELELAAADGAELPRRVQVVAALAGEAGDRPPEEWRELDSFTRLRLRGTTASAEALAAGSYRFAVTGLGIHATVGDVVVAAGEERKVPVTVREQTPAEFIGGLDKDGDGKLSTEELPPEMRRMMERVDADGDGFASEQELGALQESMRTREGPPTPGFARPGTARPRSPR